MPNTIDGMIPKVILMAEFYLTSAVQDIFQFNSPKVLIPFSSSIALSTIFALLSLVIFVGIWYRLLCDFQFYHLQPSIVSHVLSSII